MSFSDSPLTIAIVIVTATITIASFSRPALFRFLLLDIGDVLGRSTEWWRIFTSGFVHGDYAHLMMNMVSLYFFGSWLEAVMEPWRFGLVYSIGIIGGSFAAVVVHRYNAEYRAVGASGGVCAVIGAVTALAPDLSMMIFPIPIPISAWIYGCIFVFFSVLGAARGRDAIGHEAHLGGTFAGIGLACAFYPAIAFGNALEILAILGAGGVAFVVSKRFYPEE